MAQAHILVVDDEQDIRVLVSEILEDEGYAVSTAEHGEAARAAFARRTPDLVLLDIWMPDVDGISLLKEWSESGRLSCPVVMMTGHGTLETAVEATRLGAQDFVQKPLSLAKLLATVKTALASGSAAAATPKEPSAAPPPGNSPQMKLLRRMATQAATAEAPILITGEAGSGKESLAAWIHQQAGAKGRLLPLDRLRLASDAALEYLVGGPDAPGVLAQASGGTLFIPDLHDVAPEAQSVLSAILAAGAYTPEGAMEPQSLTCRVIAGIDEEPEAAISAGRLDPALHLQVSVLPLHVPPLRERPEDVPDLVSHHTDRLSNSEGLAYRSFSISALNRLRNHDWPGNEQELINLVKRLLVLGNEGEVDVREVEEALQQPAGPGSRDARARPVSFDLPLREAREAFERDYLTYQLRKAGGSVGKLSEAVGMERTHLYRKLRSLGIDPKKVVAET
ncbi:MAG: sigma-54 dependent transcriptional regulator [Xanthomonadales bacterium]|jgi:DNA-binding NtrC family response regulator|nr:sigma-54 dependent transcriptional regulator [Xanthomonadales bacterium]